MKPNRRLQCRTELWLGLLLLATAWPLRTFSQPSMVPRQDFWQIGNNLVFATLVTNGVAYVGGYFAEIFRQGRQSDMVLSLETGLNESNFPQANDDCVCVIPDGAGGWYLGGWFTAVGGVARTNLVHILPDNTVDPDWLPNPDGGVNALAISGNRLYVGGYYDMIGGQTRTNLAAFDLATGQLTGWNPRGNAQLIEDIRALEADGDTVYVGGGSPVSGSEGRRLVALDATTGDEKNWPAEIDDWGSVRALKVVGSKLLVGGGFIELGGVRRSNLGAVDKLSGRVTDWNPNANNAVNDLAVSCDVVYVGGFFTEIGGVPREQLAAVDLQTGAPTAWNLGSDAYIKSLTLVGDVLYAGGGFTRIGGQPRGNVAALDLATGQATAWRAPEGCPSVYQLAAFGGRLFVAGVAVADNLARYNLAAFDAVTGQPTPWNPRPDYAVYALAAHGDTLFVGGAFSTIGGLDRSGLGAVKMDSGQVTSWNPKLDASGVVDFLLIGGNTLYASG